MRPVLPGDLDRAVGALLAVPNAERAELAADLVRTARIADLYRKRLGRVHPTWGDGSLMAAAMARPRQPLPPCFSREARTALRQVLDALGTGLDPGPGL